MNQSLDEVLELFAKYQRRLYVYILSLIHNPIDAEEVLQNTNILVWQKFSQFQPGSDFRAWVFQICYYEICKYRRHRSPELSFSPDLLDQLTVTYRDHANLLEMQQDTLPGCVEQLPADDRQLLDATYSQGIGVARLAAEMGREPTSVYRSLRRIRQWLRKCIERAISNDIKP